MKKLLRVRTEERTYVPPDGPTAVSAGLRPHLALGALLFALYSALSISRHIRFDHPSWDVAIFEQVARAYSQLQAPIVPIKGPDFNILGDHFSPILALLGPLYRVFPSPVTILLVQAALFAVSAVVVSHTATLFLGRVRGLLAGAAYGVSWGVQRAVDVGFHEICFAAPLLAICLRKLLQSDWRKAAYWASPLVLVKEDLGLTVAAVGVCIFIAGGKRIGAVLAAYGIVATVIVMTVIIPMFNPVGGYDYWDKMASGGDESAGLGTALFTEAGVKAETLVWLFGIVAFIALRSVLSLVAIPTLAWRFLSEESNYWGTDWHYSAVLMPVVFMAFLDAVRSSSSSPRGWVRQYAQSAVPVMAAVAVVLCMQLPLRDVLRPGFYDGGSNAEAAQRAVSHVPDGVTVEANTGLMTHLTSRTVVYWVGNTGSLAPQYVALDLASGWAAPPTDPVAYVEQLHPDARYDLVFREGRYVVMALRGTG
ncbi:DUF2079 domain-containing protein [Streptomyces albidoflavus]